MKAAKHRLWLPVLWFVLAVALSSGHRLSPFCSQVPLFDSSIFIACAQWMRDGLVMYRDIFDHKGPFIYLYDRLGLAAGGLTGLWLLDVLWLVLSTLLTYRTCRLFASWQASAVAATLCLGVLSSVAGDNTVELVALPFQGLAVWRMLSALRRKETMSFADIFLSAACFAVVALLKPNITAFMCLLALAVFVQLCLQWNARHLLRYLAAAVLGLAVVVIPVTAYLLANHAWPDFVSAFWTFNTEYSAGQGWSERMHSSVRLIFLYTPSLLSWLFVLWACWRSCERVAMWRLLPVLVVGAWLNAGLSGFPFPHYMAPVYPMLALYAAAALQGVWSQPRPWRMLAIALCLISFGFSLRGVQRSVRLHVRSRSEMADVRAMAQYAARRVPASGSMAVLYGDANLFVLSGCRPASKYFYQHPICRVRPSMVDSLQADICRRRPQLIVCPMEHIMSCPIKLPTGYVRLTDAPRRFVVYGLAAD